MTILQAFLQGVLQGLTEFLPVSSSGHLSLFQYFSGHAGDTGFLFSILLHAGTLVAVCILFWRTILELIVEGLRLLGDLVTGRLFRRGMRSFPPARRMLLMLALSLLPLFVMLLFKDFVEQFSTDRDITVEGFCFLITGLLLTVASRHDRGRRTAKDMTAKSAAAIGIAQVVATMPGISRSGSTICTGMLWGLQREFAVTYSFILGIPAVLGAIVLEVPDAVREGIQLPLGVILTGFFTSLVVGILAIRTVQWVVRGNKLKYFGWYTLALGTLTLVVGFSDRLLGYPIQQFFSSL